MRKQLIAYLLLFLSLQFLMSCDGNKKSGKNDLLLPNLEEIEPNNKLSEAQAVSDGTIVKGFIGEKQDQDWYSITIPEDSTTILKAELTGIQGINLKLELFDKDQDVLLEIDRLKDGDGEILTNYYLESGIVYLRVRELWLKEQEKKFNDSLAYNLRFHLNKAIPDAEREPNNKAIHATMLTPNVFLKGYISPYHDIDWYKLPIVGQGDKYLELSLSGLERVDSRLTVYDPIEAVIKGVNRNRKGEGEKITNLGMETAREFYYVVVSGEKWQTDEKNSYELMARFIDMPHLMEFEPNDRLIKATAISAGDTVFGYIDDGDDVDWYQIKRDVAESQVARIELTGIPKIDFKLTVTDELEETILSVDDTGEQENEFITNVGLIGSEAYYIKVETKNKGANVDNQYALSVQLNSYLSTEEFEFNNVPEAANPILLERAVSGYIHPIGDVDFYRFDVPHRPLGKLEIVLEGIMKVNTDMVLYDESMSQIATANAKTSEGIERLVFDGYPGVYYIKVYDNDGKESNYRDNYKLAIFVKPTD